MPNDFSSRAEAIRSRCEHLQRQAGNLQAWLDSNSLNDPPIIETITDDLGGGRDDTTVPETMIQCAADTLAMLAAIARLTAQVETLQGERDERDATVRATAFDLEGQIQRLQAERDAAFTLPVLLLEGSIDTPDYYSQRTSFERDLYQLWVRLKIRLERADAAQSQVTALQALLRGIEDFCRRESQKPPTDAADAAVSETCSHVGQQIRAALGEKEGV